MLWTSPHSDVRPASGDTVLAYLCNRSVDAAHVCGPSQLQGLASVKVISTPPASRLNGGEADACEWITHQCSLMRLVNCDRELLCQKQHSEFQLSPVLYDFIHVNYPIIDLGGRVKIHPQCGNPLAKRSWVLSSGSHILL